MLIGLDQGPATGARFHMRRSGYGFYLTGSRFFGFAKENSDWDFFTNYTRSTSQDLARWGFRRPACPTSYRDSLIVEVWRHSAEKIDVQLVKDANLKWRAQLYLRNYAYLLKKMDKTSVDLLWDFAFAMANNIPFSRATYVASGLGSNCDPDYVASQHEQRHLRSIRSELAKF